MASTGDDIKDALESFDIVEQSILNGVTPLPIGVTAIRGD